MVERKRERKRAVISELQPERGCEWWPAARVKTRQLKGYRFFDKGE